MICDCTSNFLLERHAAESQFPRRTNHVKTKMFRKITYPLSHLFRACTDPFKIFAFNFSLSFIYNSNGKKNINDQHNFLYAVVVVLFNEKLLQYNESRNLKQKIK